MNINYLKKEDQRLHVSNDLIIEFESTILNDCNTILVKKSVIDPILLRLNYKLPNIKIPISRKKTTFSILMGVGDFRFFIKYYKTNLHNAVYLFDAWPIHYDYIKFACKSLNINYLFCSSKIASENLSKILINTHVFWVPEAIDMSCYLNKDYKEKEIDILQFGRKYDKIQDELINISKINNIKYLYQNNGLLFPTRKDFVNGLASSKISLCFPRSLTHPDIAKDQETMTSRYLQSMASKTLVVGRCPEEMKQIFPYNPVIDLSLSHPAEHLVDILHHYDDYIPLIEKNYIEVKQHHQWKNRWACIKSNILLNKPIQDVLPLEW